MTRSMLGLWLVAGLMVPATGFAEGRTVSRSGEGVRERTEDGARFRWKETVTSPRGTGNRQGERVMTRTDDGRSWTGTFSGQGPGGRTWTGEGRGQASRADGTRTWTRTAEGEGPEGRTWTSEASGRGVRNEDGTITVRATRIVRIEDGCDEKVIRCTRETVITPGENGRTWHSKITREGPRGTRNLAVRGEATREGNRTRWKAEGEPAP